MFVKEATAEALGRKRGTRKIVSAYTSLITQVRRAAKMVNPNVNMMGKKRKNSDTLTQARECKMIKVCKAIYSAQRG